MVATFHCFGIVEVVTDLLNRRSSGPQKTGVPKRRNHTGSKSRPVD